MIEELFDDIPPLINGTKIKFHKNNPKCCEEIKILVEKVCEEKKYG